MTADSSKTLREELIEAHIGLFEEGFELQVNDGWHELVRSGCKTLNDIKHYFRPGYLFIITAITRDVVGLNIVVNRKGTPDIAGHMISGVTKTIKDLSHRTCEKCGRHGELKDPYQIPRIGCELH